MDFYSINDIYNFSIFFNFTGKKKTSPKYVVETVCF